MSYFNSNNHSTGPLTTTTPYRRTYSSGSPTTLNHSYQSNYSFCKGQTISQYHARKKRGEFLPYTQWRQFEGSVEIVPGSHKVNRNNGYWEEATGCHSLALVTTIPINEDPDMSGAAYSLQRAAADIYTSGWDALTFSAELPKTVRMFRGTARKMVDLARKFSPEKAKSAWLEGRYGYRVLAYDVKDLHSAVKEFDAKREFYSARSGDSHSTYASGEASFSDSDALYKYGWEEKTTYSIRGSVAALITPSRILTNPVLTAWELVPYSFVVDWVLGVGTAINAISFLAAQRQHTASVGYKAERTYTKWMTAEKKPGSSYTVTGPGYKSIATTTQVLRSPTSLSITPKLTGRWVSPDLTTDLWALARSRR